MEKVRILLVDDDRTLRDQVRRLFEADGARVAEAGSVAEAAKAFDAFRPDFVLLDYSLPDGTALDLLPDFKGKDPEVPVVLLTGHGEVELAVSTIKAGADQFLVKPVELGSLRETVGRILDERRSARRGRAGARREDRTELDPFAGDSPGIRSLAHDSRIAAEAQSPILITGETGTGKGVLARWLHSRGPRAQEAFVDLNCAGLSRELLDSELFGHVRGAFTGAVQNKAGLFQVADRGTIFLDEIGDIDAGVQPKILKVVEEQRFRRLGEVQERRVDVRLVAATHRDLAAAVAAGDFRADLFYRLNTLQLRLPPLRDRIADLPALAGAILERLKHETGRSASLEPDGLEALRGYDWPGNIRELRNVLERAMLFASEGRIDAAALHFEPAGAAPARHRGGVEFDTSLQLAEVERRHIEAVLSKEHGQVDRAAEILGIPRSTLYQRLKELGLSPSSFRDSSAGGPSKSV